MVETVKLSALQSDFEGFIEINWKCFLRFHWFIISVEQEKDSSHQLMFMITRTATSNQDYYCYYFTSSLLTKVIIKLIKICYLTILSSISFALLLSPCNRGMRVFNSNLCLSWTESSLSNRSLLCLTASLLFHFHLVRYFSIGVLFSCHHLFQSKELFWKEECSQSFSTVIFTLLSLSGELLIEVIIGWDFQLLGIKFRILVWWIRNKK